MNLEVVSLILGTAVCYLLLLFSRTFLVDTIKVFWQRRTGIINEEFTESVFFLWVFKLRYLIIISQDKYKFILDKHTIGK